MMIKRFIWMAALLLAVACGASAEQQVPDAECFSPGLARLSEGLESGAPLTAELGASAEHFFYIRDLSLIRCLLKGMTFSYSGEGTLTEGSDAIAVRRDGETVFSASLERNGDISRAEIGDSVYSVDTQALLNALGVSEVEQPWQQAALRLAGPALFNRIALSDAENWLRDTTVGTELPGGVKITKPFEVRETWSDDGLRFTRLDLSGEAETAGGQRFTIEGYLRTPGGKNPKDNAVLVFAADENSTLTLEMSSVHQSTADKKKTKGSASVDTTVKVSGKLNGYALSTRLTIRQQNDWTCSDGVLKEKLSLSLNVGHTDKTPGRRKLRLNDLSGKLRLNLRVSSDGSKTALDGTVSATLDMDSNDALDAELSLSAEQGGDPAVRKADGTETPAELSELSDALTQECFAAAQRLYAQLPQDVKEKLSDGLATETTQLEESK